MRTSAPIARLWVCRLFGLLKSHVRNKVERGHKSISRRGISADRSIAVTVVWHCYPQRRIVCVQLRVFGERQLFQSSSSSACWPTSQFFVRWYNVEVFGVPPQLCGKVFVAVRFWWVYYEGIRLLYVPTPPVFAYHSGMYKASSDNPDCLMIARTENVLIPLACFSRHVTTVI